MHKYYNYNTEGNYTSTSLAVAQYVLSTQYYSCMPINMNQVYTFQDKSANFSRLTVNIIMITSNRILSSETICLLLRFTN